MNPHHSMVNLGSNPSMNMYPQNSLSQMYGSQYQQPANPYNNAVPNNNQILSNPNNDPIIDSIIKQNQVLQYLT